jgi:hypothetical protein
MNEAELQVRGGATAEEVAAIVAALQRQRREPVASRLEQWRRLRQQVLRDNR